MKPVPLLLIVLGTIFGPVYFAYCEYLSGETAETHTLTERADRWELPDGAILRFRGGLGYRPVVLDLTPELNLYRFRFTFDAARPESSPKDAGNEYGVSVLEGDVGIFERSFRAVGNGAISVALDPMQIPYPSSYMLLLEEVGTPQLQVAGVKLEVRTKVKKMEMWLVWSGLALIVFGAVIIIRDLVTQSFGK
ncbi:MAG TPA: hypothetical protein VJT81_04455 [Burkholderiales bacterium]|nr:hypothetical protein [Burkholderiales bacterium]